MYKAPPPEVSSEQFYETDPSRGFARGFSIQTVSPMPIGWAEHVQAEGHWGRALREYMRDYNHWATVGVLNELLPRPDNRVTLADERDPYGLFRGSTAIHHLLYTTGNIRGPRSDGPPCGREPETDTPHCSGGVAFPSVMDWPI